MIDFATVVVSGSLRSNQPEPGQCGFERRRQVSNIFWFEYGPVFAFQDRPNWHVQPQRAPQVRGSMF